MIEHAFAVLKHKANQMHSKSLPSHMHAWANHSRFHTAQQSFWTSIQQMQMCGTIEGKELAP